MCFQCYSMFPQGTCYWGQHNLVLIASKRLKDTKSDIKPILLIPTFLGPGIPEAFRDFPGKHEEGSVLAGDRTRHRNLRRVAVRRSHRRRVPETEARSAEAASGFRIAPGQDSGRRASGRVRLAALQRRHAGQEPRFELGTLGLNFFVSVLALVVLFRTVCTDLAFCFIVKQKPLEVFNKIYWNRSSSLISNIHRKRG